MISINELNFSYNKTPVFTGVTATMEQGRIYGILGRNGTGKSTLLYNIAGLLYPNGGSVEVLGFTPKKRQSRFLQHVFMIPEEFHLPDIPIRKFLQYSSPFYPKFDQDAFYKYINHFDIPEHSTLQAMSYGQKKKVLISFGVATNAEVLLMDEPTNGLDIISKGQMRKVIASAMNENKCFLISTHQVKDLENLIDDVIILGSTRIILKNSLQQIADKLEFKVSFDDDDLGDALYSEPLVRGNTIVAENISGYESKVDLELLYKAAMANPARMHYVLT